MPPLTRCCPPVLILSSLRAQVSCCRFHAENVRPMVSKQASMILIGPDTGLWVSWMMSHVVEITNWHVHTFPFFTSTDDRMWDPKNQRKMLYRNPPNSDGYGANSS